MSYARFTDKSNLYAYWNSSLSTEEGGPVLTVHSSFSDGVRTWPTIDLICKDAKDLQRVLAEFLKDVEEA